MAAYDIFLMLLIFRMEILLYPVLRPAHETTAPSSRLRRIDACSRSSTVCGRSDYHAQATCAAQWRHSGAHPNSNASTHFFANAGTGAGAHAHSYCRAGLLGL